MKKLFTSVLAMLALFWLAACTLENGASSNSNAASGASSDAKPTVVTGDKTIGLSISTLNNPFFVTLNDAAKAKADSLQAKLTVVDAQNDASKQAADVEDLIQQGVKLIIINPVDSAAVASAIESAAKQSISSVWRSDLNGNLFPAARIALFKAVLAVMVAIYITPQSLNSA